ncbi:MAG TPA: type II secretion system F family protein [Anaerolineales bacterium]|nr:type II secretion system F family protein [Anaerolineales bacterium]
MIGIVIGGGIFLIIILLIGLVVSISSERAMLDQRLGQYLGDDKSKAGADAGGVAVGGQSVLTDWVSKRVERTSFGDGIQRQLARADIKLRVAEYIALIVISTIVAGAVAYLLGSRLPISFLIGAVIGFFAPRFYVNGQQKRRLTRFNDQLSDMLNLMVNGLRAGYSTMQAMEAVSKEMPTPICDEFRRVVQEMQIGIPMEVALENLLRRIPSDDLDFVVTAINVQREVGGNLSEILDTISFTIRERVRIKGEIRTLTAQVRTSGSVLSLIPVFLTLVLWFLNPNYLMSLQDGGPYCVVGVAVAVIFLITTGYLIMMKIADIEV